MPDSVTTPIKERMIPAARSLELQHHGPRASARADENGQLSELLTVGMNCAQPFANSESCASRDDEKQPPGQFEAPARAR